MALAASGHVAYDSVSLVFPYPNLPFRTATASTNHEVITVPLLEGSEYISSPGSKPGLGGPGPELTST